MLLLSYVKILNVTITIFHHNYYVYYMDGSRDPPYYFAATGKRYLSKGHVDYLIIAFVMGFVFNILPIFLLCFYISLSLVSEVS